MQRQDHAVAPGDVAVDPLDLVGVEVRRRHLDRRRQVEDGPALRRRLPDLHHRLADLLCKVELGAGEAFGRVLVDDLGIAFLAYLSRLGANARRALYGNVDDGGALQAVADQATPRGGGWKEGGAG